MRTLYACVYCVPGSPLCPHPLTRLCVWRLLPARLLTDPGLPGSMGIPGCAFHKVGRNAALQQDLGWKGGEIGGGPYESVRFDDNGKGRLRVAPPYQAHASR